MGFQGGTGYVPSNRNLGNGVTLCFGASDDACFVYDVTDANAAVLMLDFEKATANDVPVFVVGDDIIGVDLGLFNGITEPAIAVVDDNNDSAVRLGFVANDRPAVMFHGSAGPLEIIRAGLPLVVQNTTVQADDQVLVLRGPDQAGAEAIGDEIYLSFEQDTVDGMTEVVRLTSELLSPAAGTTDARFSIDVMTADALVTMFQIDSSAAGVITTTIPTGDLILEDGVSLLLGTGGAESDLSSDGANTLWNLTSGVLAILGANTVLGSGEGHAVTTSGQTLRAPDMVGGTTVDAVGADLTIAAGLGTGNGDVGTIIFSLPDQNGASNSTLQDRATRLTLDMVASTTVLTMQAAQALTLGTAAGDLRFNPTANIVASDYITFDTGVAATAGNYEIGRNNDGTNLLQANVPTGASFEWSVNNVAEMTLSATTLDLRNNILDNVGGGNNIWDANTLTVSDSAGATNTVLTVQNTSNTAATSEHAIVNIAVGGSTTIGDPQLRLTIPSGTSYYMGIDNSFRDRLSIGSGSVVGTTELLNLDGEISGQEMFFGLTIRLKNVTLDNGVSMSYNRLLIDSTTATLNGTSTVTAPFDIVEFSGMSLVAGAGARTVNEVNAFVIDLADIGATITVPVLTGLHIREVDAHGGTVTTQYGILIDDMTFGSADIGIAVAGADTACFWVSSAVDTTDVANGIAFGLSRDTVLFRSATNTLTTGLPTTGSTMTLEVENSDNSNTASHAVLEATVGGASGGDPHIRFTIPSGTSYYMGIDNSDSDRFSFGLGTTVAVDRILVLDGRTSGAASLIRYFIPADLNPTLDNSAGARYTKFYVDLQTATLAGTTQVTSPWPYVTIKQLRINQSGGAVIIDEVDALEIINPHAGASVTITEMSGIRVKNGVATGTVSTQYGLYVEDMTVGGVDYGIYLAGADTAAIYVAADGIVIAGGSLDLSNQGSLINVGVSGNDWTSTALSLGDDVLIRRDVNATITASTTQTQGNGALTAEVNEVSTVANANDTVTLPTAVAGLKIVIINNGANTLRIFPASSDNLGAGVDTATALAAASNVVFVTYDDTNWEIV